MHGGGVGVMGKGKGGGQGRRVGWGQWWKGDRVVGGSVVQGRRGEGGSVVEKGDGVVGVNDGRETGEGGSHLHSSDIEREGRVGAGGQGQEGACHHYISDSSVF